MGKYKKLGKNVALLTIGNFASKILSFLLVPFYTSILSTSEYGMADMVTTSVNLIIPIFTLLVYEAVMRYALDEMSDKKQVFSVGLYISIIGCFVVVIVAQPLRALDSFRPLVWMFILYYVSLVFYNLILQFVKGIEKVLIYSVAGVVNTFVYIICNIVFLMFCNLGAKGYLLAFICGHTVAAIYAFVTAKVYRYIIWYGKINCEYYSNMIKYAAPMIPNSISWWVSNSSDKYILTYFCGAAENGIYSVAYKIPSILTIVINIFISAWQISAVEDFGSEESKKFYSDIYDKYEGMLFIGAALLIGSSKIIAQYLFSNAFFAAWMFTPVLICASVFNSLAAFYGSIYTSAQKTQMLFYSTLIGAIGNIVLNIVLIPLWGAMGAAIATLMGYVVVWLVRVVNSKKIFEFRIKTYRDVIVICVLAVEIVFVCIDINPCYLVSIISSVLVCFICKNVLLDIIKVLLHKVNRA